MQPGITIITPCYNENSVVVRFLEGLEISLAPHPCHFRVVVVNDHSTDNTLCLLKNFLFTAPNMQLDILDLKTNVGHQAAIYQGVLYASKLHSDHFIVMDSDGEDSPDIIPALLQLRRADIVNVVRSRRRESLVFRLLYRIYKYIFRLVTGKQMNFGNFCLISRPVLEMAAKKGFLHFAAFLSQQEVTTAYVTADRAERLGGHSKMSFVKLLQHGLRSFAEYRHDHQYCPGPGFYTLILPAADSVGKQSDAALTPLSCK